MLTQQQRRSQLFGLLGELPPLNRPIRVLERDEQQHDSYVLEHLLLDLNDQEEVPALFVKPLNVTKPLPTVLFNHSHGRRYEIGKDELITGAPWMADPPPVEALVAQGYAVLCIDQYGFSGRQHMRESEIFRHMLWHGRVMWGMMVYDGIKAVDYLISRDDVDATRIATMGMSLGSTMSWWLAALDERIKVCIDICCLTDFEEIVRLEELDRHGLYYYVPGLLKHFSTAQINALIAPRPHLALEGELDPLTPPAGLDRIDAELQKVYEAAGARDAWKLSPYRVGHTETPQMRCEAIAWLGKWL